jgi:hypothetical protein
MRFDANTRQRENGWPGDSEGMYVAVDRGEDFFRTFVMVRVRWDWFLRLVKWEWMRATDMGQQVPRYKRIIPRRILVVLASILVIGTVAGSFLPGSTKERLGTQPTQQSSAHSDWGHRAYHFATFGTTALAILLLMSGFRAEVKGGLSVFALGCAIEVTQYALGFSTVLEWWDVRDDFYAVAAVFVLVQAANARSQEESP